MYDCLIDEELNAVGGQDLDNEGKGDEKNSSSSGLMDDDDNYIRYLDETDHMAVVCVHAFIQNLYFYASENNEIYRNHMLVDTLLIPRLVLPYLERSVGQAAVLTER